MQESQESLMRVFLHELPRLRRLAASFLADPSQVEDVLQETALVALQWPPEENWGAHRWLRGVVRNIARALMRHERNRRRRERGRASPDFVLPPTSPLERQEDSSRLRLALGRLPVSYRAVILLRYFGGRSPRDIARMSGVPLNTIKSRLRRALRQLRHVLEQGQNQRSLVRGCSDCRER